jgi:surface protein
MYCLVSKRVFLFLFSFFIFSFSGTALEFTIDTNITGETPDTKFLISTHGSGYDYALDCEDDGTLDYGGLTGDFNCSYPSAGVYHIKIYGDFPEIYFNSSHNQDSKKIISLDAWDDHEFRTLEKAFYRASNLEINATDIPNLENVTSMKQAFTDIRAINSSNLNDWNVSNVENMAVLFYDINHFNQNISDWDVSHVKNMSAMFGETAFNSDISSWDVSQVEDMSFMFTIVQEFNQDIGDWNVSNVTDMTYMFQQVYYFNQDIGNWDMSKVESIEGMFSGAEKFNQDISGWNLASLNGSLHNLFYYATAFNQDVGGWNVSQVTDMNDSFNTARSFNQDLGDWNISNVTGMYNMFRETNLSISNYDNTLNGWYNNPTHRENINMNEVCAYYCDEDENGRYELMNSEGWIIDDIAQNCSFHIITSDRVTLNSGDIDVINVDANKGEGEDTYHSIVSGADADKFSINDYGELKFISAPNGNRPTDKNRDNIYRVQVMAEDQGEKDFQTIKVEVLPNDTSSLVSTIMYLLN